MPARKSTIARCALGTVLVLGAIAQPVAAQDEWEGQVRRLLQTYASSFEANGYAMTHRIFTGSLYQGASETVTINLSSGKTYQILGACDNDCTDLDTTLYGPSGNQIDIDVEYDDYPVVSATPPRRGTYQVRVSMATCSVDPCRYGIAVFAR